MRFNDTWDFDSKPWGERSYYGEVLTRIGNAWLPGRPFEITSGSAPVTQSSRDREAIWSGTDVEGTPSRLARTIQRTIPEAKVGMIGDAESEQEQEQQELKR